MRIIERKGSYDLIHPEKKQWQVAISGLPEDAPNQAVSAMFDEEQGIDDLPPSEVVEFISDKIESLWISTSREEKRETIEWIRENAERLDKIWAKKEIERTKKEIKRLQSYVDDLRQDFLA